MVNYPHRRAGAGAGARDGRHAVLQVVRARRRARAEHRHGLQRPRPRRSPAGGLLQPVPTRPAPCSSRAISTGPRSSPAACAGSTPAASSPSLSETTVATDHRRDAGRQGRRRDHLVRPELPGQALGVGRRRRAGPAGHQARSPANVDALIGNEEDLQKGLGIAGPGGRRQVEARPRHVLRDDRPGGRAVSQHQAGGDDAARGALDQPPRLGGGALARRPAVRQPDLPARRASTASAAATASPPA